METKKVKTMGLHNLHPSQLKSLAIKKNHADGGGLFLYKSNPQKGSWKFIYTFDSVRREMSLGLYPEYSLSEARDKAEDCRRLRARGICPLTQQNQAKEAEKAKSQGKITFIQFFRQWFELTKKPTLTSATNIQQWNYTINHYCAAIHDRPIDEIDEIEIAALLKGIWQTKHETADKLRNRLEQIFNAAVGQKLRARGLNPAEYKNCLDAYLPDVSNVLVVNHHASLDWRKMPQFMQILRTQDFASAIALEFIILNVNRLSEALNAKWREFDLVDNIWTIPAQRMKVRKNGEHKIPLSNRSIEILEIMKQFATDDNGELDLNALVFKGAHGGNKPMSITSIEKRVNNVMGKIGKDHATPHGFRSSFRDWGFELGGVDAELMEVCLAHSAGGEIKNYRRGDALQRRRIVMQSWCDYCSNIEKNNVVIYPQ